MSSYRSREGETPIRTIDTCDYGLVRKSLNVKLQRVQLKGNSDESLRERWQRGCVILLVRFISVTMSTAVVYTFIRERLFNYVRVNCCARDCERITPFSSAVALQPSFVVRCIHTRRPPPTVYSTDIQIVKSNNAGRI